MPAKLPLPRGWKCRVRSSRSDPPRSPSLLDLDGRGCVRPSLLSPPSAVSCPTIPFPSSAAARGNLEALRVGRD